MTKEQKEREEIKMCLNCPLYECVDCLGDSHHNPAHVRRLAKMMELAMLGWNDKQIAQELGVLSNTVYRMRKRLGIPNYRERKYGRAAARV